MPEVTVRLDAAVAQVLYEALGAALSPSPEPVSSTASPSVAADTPEPFVVLDPSFALSPVSVLCGVPAGRVDATIVSFTEGNPWPRAA